MDIQTLIANRDSFPLLSKDQPWDFGNVLSGLYADALQIFDMQTEIADWLNRDDFEVHDVFDFYHLSDESCYVQLVSYKRTPFGLVYMFGEQSTPDYEVLNLDVYKQVGTLIATQRAIVAMNEVGVTETTSLGQLGGLYMRWLDETRGLFSMERPNSHHGFVRMLEKYPAMYQTPEGAIKVLRTIGGFSETHQNGHKCMVVVTFEDGATATIDGRDIVFSLLPADMRLVAAAAVNTAYAWRAEGKVLKHIARISEWQPGRVGKRPVSIAFKAPADRDAFVEKAGRAQHIGMFDPSSVGGERIPAR